MGIGQVGPQPKQAQCTPQQPRPHSSTLSDHETQRTQGAEPTEPLPLPRREVRSNLKRHAPIPRAGRAWLTLDCLPGGSATLSLGLAIWKAPSQKVLLAVRPTKVRPSQRPQCSGLNHSKTASLSAPSPPPLPKLEPAQKGFPELCKWLRF